MKLASEKEAKVLTYPNHRLRYNSTGSHPRPITVIASSTVPAQPVQ